MALFELTLALLFGAVIVAGFARKAAAPYPAFLALAGAALAFLPHAPVVEIEPDLALALFVAPVLLDAAFDTSPRDLKRYAAPLISLVLVAVLLTTAAVAYVAWRDWRACRSRLASRSGRSSLRPTPRRRRPCSLNCGRRVGPWLSSNPKAYSMTLLRF